MLSPLPLRPQKQTGMIATTIADTMELHLSATMIGHMIIGQIIGNTIDYDDEQKMVKQAKIDDMM